MKYTKNWGSKWLLAGLIMLVSLASTAQGSLIANYNFFSNSGDEVFVNPNYVSSEYTFYSLNRMTGLTAGPPLANSFNSTIDYAVQPDYRFYSWFGVIVTSRDKSGRISHPF
jgi:hypothetical protein